MKTTTTDKSFDSKSQANAKHVQNQGSFSFQDNRAESVVQTQMIQMANNSPQVKQMKAFHQMANSNAPIQQKSDGVIQKGGGKRLLSGGMRVLGALGTGVGLAAGGIEGYRRFNDGDNMGAARAVAGGVLPALAGPVGGVAGQVLPHIGAGITFLDGVIGGNAAGAAAGAMGMMPGVVGAVGQGLGTLMDGTSLMGTGMGILNHQTADDAYQDNSLQWYHDRGLTPPPEEIEAIYNGINTGAFSHQKD